MRSVHAMRSVNAKRKRRCAAWLASLVKRIELACHRAVSHGVGPQAALASLPRAMRRALRLLCTRSNRHIDFILYAFCSRALFFLWCLAFSYKPFSYTDGCLICLVPPTGQIHPLQAVQMGMVEPVMYGEAYLVGRWSAIYVSFMRSQLR